MAILSLFVGVAALLGGIYLWLEIQKLPTKETLRGSVETYARDALSNTDKYIREIEAEWNDMYQKFNRLAGRMDKTRALETTENRNEDNIRPITRKDILRMARR